MIRSLRVSDIQPLAKGVTLTVGPLLIEASCSERDAEQLLARELPVEVATLVSFDLVGRDLVASCFAFSDHERRDLYNALTQIKGIGNHSAIAVLDCGEVGDTLRAAASKDSAYFAPVPGLGKAKIALVIDKLASRYQGMLPDPIPSPVQALVEAREALVASGQAADDAELALIEAMKAAPTAPKDAESWLALLSS